jgi:hypothetical protein
LDIVPSKEGPYSPTLYTCDFDWDPQVTGVTVSSPKVSAAQGESVQFSAAVAWYRGESQAVLWKLNGFESPGTTSGGSFIDGNGLLTVGAGESSPSLTVTAVSADDPWVSSNSKGISVVLPAVTRNHPGLYIGNSTTPEDVNEYNDNSGISGLLGKALRYLGYNAVSGTLYTIVLDEDISVSSIGNLSFGQVDVTLEGLGVEWIISKVSNVGNIFAIGNGTTLTLGNNITLKGMNNITPLVSVASGKLIMLEGSKITGNTNSGSTYANQGGGVTVGINGTFEMRGGEISENTRIEQSGGGGVCNNGTFVMFGGIICGNTASNSNSNYVYAGGVLTGSSSATFIKTGGVIYGVNPGRSGYNPDDDNTAGGSGTTKANAVLYYADGSWHGIDGDLTGDLTLP